MQIAQEKMDGETMESPKDLIKNMKNIKE